MYSLDTSVFMDWQARYYPLDLFPSLETKFDELIADGNGRAVQLVKEEIDAVGAHAGQRDYVGIGGPRQAAPAHRRPNRQGRVVEP